MLTVSLILIVAAFLMTLVHAAGKLPQLWIPVLIICIALALQVIPLK